MTMAMLVSFQGRDTKLERFFAKNQLYSNEITKFLKIGVMGSCQKVPKFVFQIQFSIQKSSESFSLFFEEYEFRSTFFVTGIF